MMAYSKHAFNCHKCPGKGGDGGCPMRWGTVHQNVQTSGTKIIKAAGTSNSEEVGLAEIALGARLAFEVEPGAPLGGDRQTPVLVPLRGGRRGHEKSCQRSDRGSAPGDRQAHPPLCPSSTAAPDAHALSRRIMQYGRVMRQRSPPADLGPLATSNCSVRSRLYS